MKEGESSAEGSRCLSVSVGLAGRSACHGIIGERGPIVSPPETQGEDGIAF